MLWFLVKFKNRDSNAPSAKPTHGCLPWIVDKPVSDSGKIIDKIKGLFIK